MSARFAPFILLPFPRAKAPRRRRAQEGFRSTSCPERHLWRAFPGIRQGHRAGGLILGELSLRFCVVCRVHGVPAPTSARRRAAHHGRASHAPSQPPRPSPVPRPPILRSEASLVRRALPTEPLPFSTPRGGPVRGARLYRPQDCKPRADSGPVWPLLLFCP